MSLALYAAIGVTTCQTLHLVDTYQVEVTSDGVLQGTGSHGKLEGLALRLLRQQTVNQAT